MNNPTPFTRARFGIFELDLATGELRSTSGTFVKLPPQPAKVLLILVRRAGEVVTREELQREIWGGETFVDFERGLNVCIKQLRSALGDEASAPRYIETLVKRGYRFVAPVQSGADEIHSEPPSAPLVQSSHFWSQRRPVFWGGVAAVTLLLSTWFSIRERHTPARDHDRILLAVLPFANLSGDPGQNYFADGLTEEMITDLGRLQPAKLGVIGRESAIAYSQAHPGLDAISRTLGVDYALEGSVRRAPEHLMITARLVRIEDHAQVWAESYDRPLSDVFAVQRDVAQRVARSLALELLPSRQAALARASTQSTAAYDAYLRGAYAMNRGTEQGFKDALAEFADAIRQDPRFAMAYASLADAYASMLDYRFVARRSVCQVARDAADKALALDPELPDAELEQASILRTCGNAPDNTVEALYKRALDRNPGSPLGHSEYGFFLISVGKPEAALAEMQASARFDPLSARANTHVAYALLTLRRFPEAMAQAQKALALDQDLPFALYVTSRSQAAQGNFLEAIAVMQRAVQTSGGAPKYVFTLGMINSWAGRDKDAEKELSKLQAMTKQRYVPESYLRRLTGAVHEAQAASRHSWPSR